MQGLCSSKTRVWMSGQGCWPSFGSHPSWQDSHMCKSFRKNIADSVNDLPWVQWHHRDHPLWDFPHLSHNIWTHTMESKATLKKKRKRNHKIVAWRLEKELGRCWATSQASPAGSPLYLVVLFVCGLCLSQDLGAVLTFTISSYVTWEGLKLEGAKLFLVLLGGELKKYFSILNKIINNAKCVLIESWSRERQNKSILFPLSSPSLPQRGHTAVCQRVHI